MTDVQPRELFDRVAGDEVEGRHLDLHAVHERAGQIRRRRLVRTALSGAGIAACVALAVAVGGIGAPHKVADTPARRPRTTTTTDGIVWTPQPAPAWTSRAALADGAPGAAGAGPAGPSPSPSPDESGMPWDRPAYRIPATASLKTSEVPPHLVLWDDTGPTLDRAEPLRTLEMCEDPNMGYKPIGGPPISGRRWQWTSRDGRMDQELIQSVTGFAAGTGHARFLEVQRYVRPCLDSDRDVEALTSRARGAELFLLASTMTESLPGGQFVVGLARVGDVVISIQLRVKAGRDEAVDLMEHLLPTAMRRLAAAHVPPPQGQWVAPTSSDLTGAQPAGTPTGPSRR